MYSPKTKLQLDGASDSNLQYQMFQADKQATGKGIAMTFIHCMPGQARVRWWSRGLKDMGLQGMKIACLSRSVEDTLPS